MASAVFTHEVAFGRRLTDRVTYGLTDRQGYSVTTVFDRKSSKAFVRTRGSVSLLILNLPRYFWLLLSDAHAKDPLIPDSIYTKAVITLLRSHLVPSPFCFEQHLSVGKVLGPGAVLECVCGSVAKLHLFSSLHTICETVVTACDHSGRQRRAPHYRTTTSSLSYL